MNALGNVICTGILISGITKMYLRIFRMTVLELVTVVFSMFRILTRPPSMGKIQYASGVLRSLNQKRPSVSIAGEML